MSTVGSWLRKWWRGGDGSSQDETAHGPLEMFAVQVLYERYGREIYARAAVDAAFSTAVSDLAAEIREDLKHDGPPMARLLTDKTALTYYLLGHSHAVLAGLLEAALRPDASTPAAVDPDFAAVRLGAMFHLAFDGGLLQLPGPGDALARRHQVAPKTIRRVLDAAGARNLPDQLDAPPTNTGEQPRLLGPHHGPAHTPSRRAGAERRPCRGRPDRAQGAPRVRRPCHSRSGHPPASVMTCENPSARRI
ncbi:hypothetical protein [Nonomuraea sp. NPDC049709]|uniref:hypothetical protein n=1 Tax=Nonomuraea sp. NPDC049709 TaxID=3154736 RepID=UPI00344062EF